MPGNAYLHVDDMEMRFVHTRRGPVDMSLQYTEKTNLTRIITSQEIKGQGRTPIVESIHLLAHYEAHTLASIALNLSPFIFDPISSSDDDVLLTSVTFCTSTGMGVSSIAALKYAVYAFTTLEKLDESRLAVGFMR